MIDITTWMPLLLEKMQATFGERLRFVGLQGSYQRGEATEQSDIDVVTVLDSLRLEDLTRYRALLAQLPQGELACGFICEQADLLHWPRYELFPLQMGTRAYFGDLAALLPPVCRADILQGAQIGVANIYHALCHGRLYSAPDAWPRQLAGLYKQVFFTLQVLQYLRGGDYAPTRAALQAQLPPAEQALLRAQGDAGTLLAWCKAALSELDAMSSDATRPC